MKFDPTKDYADVYGASDGTRYVQNETSFDVFGNPVGEPPAAAKPASTRKSAKVSPAVEAQVEAQLADMPIGDSAEGLN